MLRFAHPSYFLLLLIIPVLIGIFLYSQIQKHRRLKTFGNPEVLSPLMPNVSQRRPVLKFILQLIAIVFLVFALAEPQFGTRVENVKRQGIEVMIALDVSNSMMAQDIAPNRLDKAKQILSKLIDQMTNDKIGLIVFAGDAYVQLPITVDYVSAKIFLSSISPKLVPRQGTAIGSAIDLAIRSFGQKSQAGRAIIVITDGENHEDNAVEAAKLAYENGIMVNVIGVGTPEGAPIPIPGTMSFKKDKEGNVVVSKLNEEMCKSIAAAGNGICVRADNTNNAYHVISKQLDNLAKTTVETKIFSNYSEQFQSFVLIALLLLIIDFFIFDRKNKKLSRINIFETFTPQKRKNE